MKEERNRRGGTQGQRDLALAVVTCRYQSRAGGLLPFQALCGHRLRRSNDRGLSAVFRMVLCDPGLHEYTVLDHLLDEFIGL